MLYYNGELDDSCLFIGIECETHDEPLVVSVEGETHDDKVGQHESSVY